MLSKKIVLYTLLTALMFFVAGCGLSIDVKKSDDKLIDTINSNEYLTFQDLIGFAYEYSIPPKVITSTEKAPGSKPDVDELRHIDYSGAAFKVSLSEITEMTTDFAFYYIDNNQDIENDRCEVVFLIGELSSNQFIMIELSADKTELNQWLLKSSDKLNGYIEKYYIISCFDYLYPFIGVLGKIENNKEPEDEIKCGIYVTNLQSYEHYGLTNHVNLINKNVIPKDIFEDVFRRFPLQ
nr:hypothetical protein [Clostridia bacterium]